MLPWQGPITHLLLRCCNVNVSDKSVKGLFSADNPISCPADWVAVQSEERCMWEERRGSDVDEQSSHRVSIISRLVKLLVFSLWSSQLLFTDQMSVPAQSEVRVVWHVCGGPYFEWQSRGTHRLLISWKMVNQSSWRFDRLSAMRRSELAESHMAPTVASYTRQQWQRVKPVTPTQA